MLNKARTLEKEIRIAIIGCGAMGKGLLHQSLITPGICCLGMADLEPDKIRRAAAEFAIEHSGFAVHQDPLPLALDPEIELLIEATDSILPAKATVEAALSSGKHVVMMNSEADLTFGPEFLALARMNGVVYTSADGDQPAVLAHLIREVTAWGLQLVVAGNIKGYLDRSATPESIKPEADKRGLSYEMCAAMTDGTKLNIEMALLANAFDLRTAAPGMLGPKAEQISEVFELYDLEGLRLGGRPVVDYVLGAAPGGGIFVIAYCADPYQRKMLKYYKMGAGPYYLFYRPYHLCHVEAMMTVARVVLNGQGVLQPDFGHKTNVYAYAKKDLNSGERLDGVGGFTCYGLIENAAEEKAGLPITEAEGSRLVRDIKKGQKITRLEVEK